MATSASTTQARLHFSRFEFKYVLTEALRRDVEAELQHFLEFDPFVQGRPDHRYFVRSLYWDSPELACFRAKVDGQHTRSKFRIRTYARTLDDPAPWFLEIKGRYNNLVFKHRAPFTGDFDRTAAGDALRALTLAHVEPGTVRTEFEYQVYRRRLVPMVLIDYIRRPYVSRFDPDFRLTFDAELTACATGAVFPGPTAVHRRLLPGRTVMEVKFRHHVPSWFHRILQAYELRRQAISKIATGTQVLGLARHPD